MSDDWGAELTGRIGAEIKRLRGDRSGQWLSDRTEELGQRVSRSTISEIETRRRKSLSVDHLILLAAALDVAAVDLIYPGGAKTHIEVLPGMQMSKFEAVELFGGSKQLNDKLVRATTKAVEALALLVEEVVDLREQLHGSTTTLDVEVVREKPVRRREESSVLNSIVSEVLEVILPDQVVSGAKSQFREDVGPSSTPQSGL
jgi:transcriptional regulator with XRE-family HTH domain